MRAVLGVLVLLSAAAAPPAIAQTRQEQVEAHRAEAAQRMFDRCSPSVACPSMWRSSLRSDRSERAREARAFNESLEILLAAGDCEGARAKAVDAGLHELAAHIRRACKAAS
ncbi:hypothetical protein [Phenylobacterium sp.]|uniref:hypothetical protein n=1 Tax=Phenylobacterium sp. TaxID=1871053 RepID=UPI003931E313